MICFNPEQAERDAALREVMVGKLTALINGTDTLSATKRAELRGRISTMPGLNRFLRVTPERPAPHRQGEDRRRGEPGRQVPAALLRPAPVRRGHRAGLQAVAAGRTRLAGHEDHPGTAPGLPPARGPHPRPRHALLARPAADPGRRDHHRPHLEPLREDLQELHVGTFTGPAGTFRQRTELTTAQRDILTKLGVDPPKKIIELGPPPATS